MKPTWQPAGISFSLRLLTLVLVPLVGLAFLGFQRIDDERSAADEARSLVEDARLQQDVAAVYGPAQLEQIALEGLAAIDAIDVPRELVVTIAGVDFESTYDDNAVEFEAALDRLAANHGDFVPSGGATLSDRLSFIRGELATQRRLSSQARAEPADVRSVFADLDELLADAVRSTRSFQIDGATSSSTNDRIALAALSEVLVRAGDRGKALLDGLINADSETATAIVIADARLDDAVNQFGDLLDPDERRTLDAVVAELQPIPESVIRSGSSPSIADEFDPTYIQDSAGSVLAQLGFLATLESYSEGFHDVAVTDLESLAVRAESSATRTQVFVAATAVLSMLILLLLSWTTLRPLRRLTKRARAIGEGTFGATPVPVRGPGDVRTLTATMNSMEATLRAIDQEIAGLASGAPSRGARRLPGTIGVSLEQSFQRLETVTAKLHESEQLASAIVEQAADAIWTIDANGIIRSANDASVDLLGVAAADQIGEPLKVYLPRTSGEVTIESVSGEPARLLVASSDIDGGGRQLTAVIARDISERLRFEERLAYQAHHDALTGLPNRFAVLEALASTAPDAPLAILFVDLDGFKSVNDTQGHVAGDSVLTEVGRRLSARIRPGDFVGRLGGDEFVVVMRNAQQGHDAVAFGYRLIAEIEQPYPIGDHLFALSASIGVATFPAGLGPDMTPLEAIRQSDSAVYAAKQRGRGRVELFDAELQARIVHDAEIELALRDAVRNDELELHLQPVHEVSSGRFTSAEALVRWHRPGVGMVPPGDFIPIAERSSLINEISRWVLRTACETLARWHAQDPTNRCKIAVNVAGSHLLDGDLVADLDAALLLSGADPELLEFELTETQIVDDHERAASILHEVRRRGTTIAIDDFGTGYSSMAYLRDLPIDTLKIDRTFIAPISTRGADTTVVDALITIGHALGLSLVAEGVEDQLQFDHLVARGCDRVQGFHLAPPMPIAEAENALGRAPDLAAATDGRGAHELGWSSASRPSS